MVEFFIALNGLLAVETIQEETVQAKNIINERYPQSMGNTLTFSCYKCLRR